MSAKYLTEAFGALELLNEDTFDITTNGVEGLQDFIASDDNVMDDFEAIIDPLAETEEELQDSYIGKVIIDCTICQSKIYKDPSEIVISEDGTLANVGEVCPYCQCSDGYKVVGQVAEYNPNAVEETEEDEETEEEEEKEEEEQEDEETEEEEVEESLETPRGLRKLNKAKRSVKESFNKVDIETEDSKLSMEADENGKVTVTTEPKDSVAENNAEEMIAPVEPEIEAEFDNEDEEDEYEDIDFDEFDETEFDQLGEKYLRRVYENVASFRTTRGKLNGNNIVLEGVIGFKSGKQAKTTFTFESKVVTKTGKLKFIGENAQFAKGKSAFTLTGVKKGNKLVAESLTYNYRAKDSKSGKSQRMYGTVKVSR